MPRRPPVTMPTVDPVHPNVGVMALYHRKLAALVTRMSDDVSHHVRLGYKEEPPVMATLATDAAWHEADHPRDRIGEFATTAGGSGAKPKLSSNEKTYLDAYTGDGFLETNRRLREGDAGGAEVRHLDAAISKSHLKTGTKLYRHLSRDAAVALFGGRDIKVGSTGSDKAYQSTGTSPILSLGGVMLEITTGEGQHGLNLSGLTRNEHENEVLLPRNTHYEITGLVAPKHPGDPVRIRVRTYADRLAMDASPAQELRKLMRKMARRWQSNFDQLAQEMAEHFAISSEDRSQRDLMASLRKAGFTVKFKPTKAQRDVFNAVVGQNVGLIKSIPQKYLGDVEGAVMRSVMAGRDVGALTQELAKTYGITQRRAAFIARDQTAKATAAFVRVRQQEAGITQALWIHSHGGKEPRPTHLENDGKPYDVATGWYDPAEGKHIWPGELISCRCVARPIIPGWNAK